MNRRRVFLLVATAFLCATFTFFTAFDVRHMMVGSSNGWDVAVLLLDGGFAVGYGWWFVTRLLRAGTGEAQ